MLSRNRWLMSVLADLSDHRGARFVELLHRLALPRDSLVRTLQTAIDAGWVMRNSGYGHPLRPEYLLTAKGERIAPGAQAIAAAQAELGLAPGALTRWGLPLICSIDSGQCRFNELARTLAGATPRALSQGLQVLAANNLVAREIVDDRPPASLYRLTKGGILLAHAAGM